MCLGKATHVRFARYKCEERKALLSGVGLAYGFRNVARGLGRFHFVFLFLFKGIGWLRTLGTDFTLCC